MLKKPLDYREQVEQLKRHGMIITDAKAAETFLSENNYYRFTGYALQYRKSQNDSDYEDGTDFESVLNLYTFDEKLRNILKKYIEIVEVYYRTVISHEFAMRKCQQPPYDQHYNENNYYRKADFKNIKDRFEKDKSYYKDSLMVKHHKKKYGGKMPLWVMVEIMSLSDVSMLYSCMYIREQEAIAKVVGVEAKSLSNHLHCIAVLRNKCAHAARLYNTTFYPSTRLNQNLLRKYPDISVDSLFAYIMVLEKRLPRVELKKQFIGDIRNLLEEYDNKIELKRIGFPEEWEQILRRQ